MLDSLKSDWLPLVQSAGIIGGLVFAGMNFRREGRAKRASNYVTLVQNYRDVWKLKIADPTLMRIFRTDLRASELSLSETEARFLSFLIFHLSTYHQLWTNGQIDKIDAIGEDIKNTFACPAIRKYWEENKKFYNRGFARFVDEYL